MFVFVPIPCCFDYCNLIVLSEVWDGYSSCLVLFPQNFFGNSGSSVIPYKFWNYLFSSVKINNPVFKEAFYKKDLKICRGSFLNLHKSYTCTQRERERQES